MKTSSRAGDYVVKKGPQEAFRVFIPAKLPPQPPIDLERVYPLLEKASLALAQLKEITQWIPNPSLFVYMYVRKEALLSSQIEGTQGSLSELLLFEQDQKPSVSTEDIEEVSHYVKAMQHGLQRLRAGFPLSMRLFKEMHAILLSGGRGKAQLPGEIRRSQNWIGGTRPGNAFFVPPSVDLLPDCLSDFESFLNNSNSPVLIKAGLAHVQFESIHPFLDGNGRLGRLIIILLLCDSHMLEEPVLYLSLYLKQNRSTYYALLQEVRDQGAWETWLEFFLEGIYVSSQQAIKTAQAINALFVSDLEKIAGLGRARKTCEKLLNFLKHLPQVSVPTLAQSLGITQPSARNAVKALMQLGILVEVSGKRRDKVYVYRNYLTMLEEGNEALE